MKISNAHLYMHVLQLQGMVLMTVADPRFRKGEVVREGGVHNEGCDYAGAPGRLRTPPAQLEGMSKLPHRGLGLHSRRLIEWLK